MWATITNIPGYRDVLYYTSFLVYMAPPYGVYYLSLKALIVKGLLKKDAMKRPNTRYSNIAKPCHEITTKEI